MSTTLTTHHVRCNHCFAEFDSAVPPEKCVNCASRDLESTPHSEGLPDLWRTIDPLELAEANEAVQPLTVDSLMFGIQMDQQVHRHPKDLDEILAMIRRVTGT